MQKYLELLKEPKSVENNTFNILLSGDGFNLTKTQTKLFNFTFSLLNDGDLSHNGYYILSIFKIEKEDYDNLKTSLNELILKFKEINKVSINNISSNVVFHLGGDLKWLSNVLGIGSANSDFPCPWCTWQTGKKDSQKWTEKEINAEWSINDRNHEIGAKLIQEKSVDKRKGYLREPLFSFIEFDKCVVDPLHLMLRISDKLFDLLLLRLEELDKNEPTFKIGDPSTYILTLIFLDFLKDERFGCNITEPYYIKDNEFKLRSLNENERIKIFEKLLICDSLIKIFPANVCQDSSLKLLNDIFKEFYEIIQLIKKEYGETFDKKDLELKIKNWLRKLVKVDNNITPYTHILCFHVPEFIDKYHNLSLFSMQGLEKLNHVTKINYFRQTNHQKNFTTTLLKKMNRMEFIHLKGNISDL